MFNKAFAKSKNKVQKGFQSTSPYLGWFIFSRYLLSLDRSKNVLFLCMTLYKIYKVCKAAVTYIEYSESKDFGQGRTSRNLKKTFNFIFTLSQLKFQCSYLLSWSHCNGNQGNNLFILWLRTFIIFKNIRYLFSMNKLLEETAWYRGRFKFSK